MWEIYHEVKLDGFAWLRERSQFSTKPGWPGRQSGRYVFRRYVINTSTGDAWIDARRPDGHYCSMRVDRVKVVHVKPKPLPRLIK